MTAPAMNLPDVVASRAVMQALSAVRDPELDEAITDLQFVQDVRIRAGAVEVDLRLPTYFCAPNFAYLMVADAHDAIAELPGVDSVVVRLVDHFASDEINTGVAARAGFAGAFPGLADDGLAEDGLAELRRTFQRKAHRAAQERVATRLVRAGWDVAALATASLADAVEGDDLDRLRRRRAELGLAHGPAAPLLVDDEGAPIDAVQLPLQLRFAKATRVSIDANAGFCRGLLSVRYGLPEATG